MPPEKDKRFTEDFIRKWSKAGGVRKKKAVSKNERILKNQEEILKKDPRNHKIWFARGILLAEMGRFEEAVRCFDAVMKLDPTNRAVYNSKASSLNQIGKTEESAKWYKRALLISAEEVDSNIGAILSEELPANVRVVLWGASVAEQGELRTVSRRVALWTDCGSTPPRRLAARCAELVS